MALFKLLISLCLPFCISFYLLFFPFFSILNCSQFHIKSKKKSTLCMYVDPLIQDISSAACGFYFPNCTDGKHETIWCLDQLWIMKAFVKQPPPHKSFWVVWTEKMFVDLDSDDRNLGQDICTELISFWYSKHILKNDMYISNSFKHITFK